MTREILLEYATRTKDSKNVRRNTAVVLFVAVLFAVWAFFKDIFSEYMIAAIPVIIINGIVIVYGCSQKARDMCVLGVCIINLCAAMAQASIGFENSILIYIVAVAATFVFAYSSRVFNAKFITFASAVATLALFAVCLVMPKVNGARAWFVIGGTPLFQITELAKLFYVLFVGGIIMSGYRESAKFLLLAGVTLFSALMLLTFINEFGTLLVMGSALYCTIMLTFKKKGYKVISTLAIIGIVLLLVLGYMSAEKRIGKWSCPECDAVNHGVVECDNCDLKVKMHEYNFKCEVCQYTTFGETKIDNSSENCKMCKDDDFFKGVIGKACKKIYDRGSLVYNYEYVKAIGDVYHLERNQQSIKAGRFFGNNDAVVYVPNVDTDSVIAGIMNRLGLVFSLIILVAFYMVFMSIGNAKSPLRIMAVCTFAFQAFYTFCGTLNLLPMTGIGMPLISRGGSNLVVSLILIYIMITAVNKNKEAQK